MATARAAWTSRRTSLTAHRRTVATGTAHMPADRAHPMCAAAGLVRGLRVGVAQQSGAVRRGCGAGPGDVTSATVFDVDGTDAD
jgi:hypothetical protein